MALQERRTPMQRMWFNLVNPQSPSTQREKEIILGKLRRSFLDAACANAGVGPSIESQKVMIEESRSVLPEFRSSLCGLRLTDERTRNAGAIVVPVLTGFFDLGALAYAHIKREMEDEMEDGKVKFALLSYSSGDNHKRRLRGEGSMKGRLFIPQQEEELLQESTHMTAYIADVIETGKTVMYIGSYLKDLGYKDVHYITSLILKGTAACISDKYIGSFSMADMWAQSALARAYRD